VNIEDPVVAPRSLDGAVDDAVDDAVDAGGPRRDSSVAARSLAALRFVSGTAAAGLLALAAVVWVAALVADDRPGPGAGAIAGHTVAAIAAVALQIVADRRRGPLAALAAVLVLALAFATLWFWWWN
jgi:hypothetical protein